MRKNRASQTAIGIARALVHASHYPPVDAILPRGAAELTRQLLEPISRRQRFELRRMKGRLYPALVRAREEHGPFRGGVKHVALRKRYFDDQVVRGLQAGATQVVVLGAGLDTVAPRNARDYPAVQFLEIDHPATQEVKREGLVSCNALTSNLHLVPLDLAKSTLRETLLNHPVFRIDQQTVFVAEGLLMYLTPDAVRSIFHLVAELGGPGTRIVFSFIETDDAGVFRMGRSGWLLRPLLALVGEPFRWGTPRAELEGLLADAGLREVEQFDDTDLVGEYLSDHPSVICLGWEYVAVAAR